MIPPTESPSTTGIRPQVTALLCRGVRRALADRGYRSLTEFRLTTGRRVDIIAIDGGGGIVIVEIKSGIADFRADDKWAAYPAWCDGFYFAVDTAFPIDCLPDTCGVMIADGFGAAIIRDAPSRPLAPARRRALTLAVARAGLGRLHRLDDPAAESGGPD
jgi:hypothetical protein